MTIVHWLTIIAWVSLPTVMYGGYSLLRLLTRAGQLTPFQATYFRAGHAHAGVLLLMALLFFAFLGQSALPDALRAALGVAVVIGVLAQSGGFFLHMGIGRPDKPSIGTTLTSVGAVILAAATITLAVGLIRAYA